MPLIKRYPNRKLYDTAAKQYVSLEGIAALIRSGEEVKVVDHATGEDLTTLTLTQIIVEQEKLRAGFLPGPVLTGLIRSGGNTLTHLARSLMAPLDLLRQVDDEIERRIRELVGVGELAAGEGQRLLDKLLSAGTDGEAAAGEDTASEDMLVRELTERMILSRADLEPLAALLDNLSAEVDALTAPKLT